MTIIRLNSMVNIYYCPPEIADDLSLQYDFDYTVREKRGRDLKYVVKRETVVERYRDTVTLPYGCAGTVVKWLEQRNPTMQCHTYWDGQLSGLQTFIQEHTNRDSQDEVLAAVVAAHKRWCYATTVIAPCGGGKTAMAVQLIALMKQRTLICVHTMELLNQWVEVLRTAFPSATIGTAKNGKFADGDVVVGLVQTLSKLPQDCLHGFGVFILDEAHHCPANTFFDVANRCPATVKLGFTASKKRADGRHPLMLATMGPVVAEIAQDTMLEEGAVTPFTVQWVETGWSTKRDAVKDYTRMIGDLCASVPRNDVIVRLALSAIQHGRHLLILSARTEHLAKLQTMFLLAGQHDKVQVIHGKLPRAEREAAMVRMQGGFPVTLATTQLAKEGLNAPPLDTLLWATPVRDPVTVQQATGRIQRTLEGKPTPIVIDLLDSVSLLRSQGATRARVYNKCGRIER